MNKLPYSELHEQWWLSNDYAKCNGIINDSVNPNRTICCPQRDNCLRYLSQSTDNYQVFLLPTTDTIQIGNCNHFIKNNV